MSACGLVVLLIGDIAYVHTLESEDPVEELLRQDREDKTPGKADFQETMMQTRGGKKGGRGGQGQGEGWFTIKQGVDEWEFVEEVLFPRPKGEVMAGATHWDRVRGVPAFPRGPIYVLDDTGINDLTADKSGTTWADRGLWKAVVDRLQRANDMMLDHGLNYNASIGGGVGNNQDKLRRFLRRFHDTDEWKDDPYHPAKARGGGRGLGGGNRASRYDIHGKPRRTA